MKWSKAIQLKATPPALPDNILSRPRLSLSRFSTAGANLLDISAPQGFGKTHLLAQWHAEAKNKGQAVLWLSMDGLDDTHQFVQGLTLASQQKDMPLVDETFASWVRETKDPIEALTGWIVEIQQSGKECFLALDDADLSSPSLQQKGLAFAMANAPGNLFIAITSRPGHPIFRQPALFGTPLIRITAQELRFTETETQEVAERTLLAQDTKELSSQLHSLTDGWPLGVKLALISQISDGVAPKPQKNISLALHEYFADNIISHQPEHIIDLLTSIANLDPIHPGLVQAVSDQSAVGDILDKLTDTTPLLVRLETRQWLRIHPAARNTLVTLHQKWPKERQQACARAASTWYANNGLHEEAAKEASRAGDRQTAINLAESAVREMTIQGRSSDVIHWLKRLSPEEINNRPAFWLPAAWAYANKNRQQKAHAYIDMLRQQPDLPENVHIEIDIIEAAMAGYRDDIRALQSFAEKWPSAFESVPASEKLLHAELITTKLLMEGEPVKARTIIEQAISDQRKDDSIAVSLVRTLADYTLGLSILWEGKPRLAYETLSPALKRVEAELNRRNHAVSTIAALLAHSAVEMMELDDAKAILSGHLHQIDKLALPDAVLYGYLAAARLSEAEDRFDLAEVQFSAIVTIGKERQVPRVVASSLAQLVRFHVRHRQFTLAHAALEELEALEVNSRKNIPTPIANIIALHANVARASMPNEAALDVTLKAATTAKSIAQKLHRGRDQLLAQALLGKAMLAYGDMNGQQEIQDAIATAHAWGLKRLHTEIVNLDANSSPQPARPKAVAEVFKAPKQGYPDMLTPREYDVLCGLAAHLSNKEIALSLGLSDETVKWHLKNLFQKLEATERKVAVVRARMLGIL